MPRSVARAAERTEGSPIGRAISAGGALIAELAKPIRDADSRVVIAFASLLIVFDAALCAAIVARVPYTKIDWDAYMQQVRTFSDGERDYMRIEGDTGPLVYPAGFLYIFTALRYATGEAIFPAQIIFGGIYLVNLALVMAITAKAGTAPVWTLALLCLSKRMVSPAMATPPPLPPLPAHARPGP